MSTSASDIRRQFRLGFYDLNTVEVAAPVAPGPSWIEDESSLASMVSSLEQDWAPVAHLGGTLPTGRPVSRASIIEELGIPAARPSGVLGSAVCIARITAAAVGLCARASVAAVRLRASSRRQES